MKRLRAQISVAPEVAPVGVAGNECDLFYLETGLKHSGDALVTQIMEMQIRDAESIARRLKGLAESLGMVLEDGLSDAYPFTHELPGLAEQRNPLIVAGLPAWIFTIPDQDKALFSIEILPPEAAHFAPAHGGCYQKANHLMEWFGERFENTYQFIWGWTSFTFPTPADQPDVRQ